LRKSDKLTGNWQSLQKHYPQLRGYDNPCYIMECKNCGKNFKTTNIDFILCKDCAAKINPKVWGI